MPLAQLNTVEKSFADNTVHTDVNLTIERGELVAALGTNGGGKTILLRLLAELLGSTSGDIFIDGAP